MNAPVPGEPLRVLVCGTNFGRFYLRALRDLGPDLVLTGVLSRGGAASRALADHLAVPHHDSLDTVGDDIDLACVAVGSTISDGAGTDLAKALLSRGVHVLQEHPVHADELVECLQLARRHRVQYRVNAHYHQVAPVQAFIAAAARLRERHRPLFVDAAGPVHVLYPLVDILGRALGGLRPWSLAQPAPHGPLRSITGQLAGVPLTLRVHNELDPADRDNHALLWHRISIGTGAGVLTLADTHGPVLWSPRLHAARDPHRRLILDGPTTGHLDQPSTGVLPGTEPATQRAIFDALWPQAIGRALTEFTDAIRQATDPLRAAQYDITATRIWADLTARLGPPDVVRPAAPHPVTMADLAEPVRPAPVGPAEPARHDEPTSDAEPYSPTAEFFDLAAADHVVAASAPAVIAALAAVDPRHGPVVEVGAGTGLLTTALAKAFPHLEILAAEPATGMRAVLSSRVFRDPDLRRRVTVSADAAPDLDLPDAISAAVVCGVAGHLDADQRTRLWRRLTQRLPPGAPIVVELMSLERPRSVDPTRLARTSIGEHDYEWWFSGEPHTGDLMRLHTTWRVLRDGETVREVTDDYYWHTISLAQIAAESGLTLRVLPAPRVSGGAPPIGVLTTPTDTVEGTDL